MKKTIYALLLALAIIGCKEKAIERHQTAGISFLVDNDKTVEAFELTDIVEEVKYEAMEVDGDPSSSISELNTHAPKIIKNANIRFETNDLKATTTAIQKAIKKHNGLVQHDSEHNDDYSISHTIAVRVPSQHFEKFIADISTGVSYFDRKEISAKDVTAEYIDVEARIKTKKKLEARYLELLKKAGKVSEMLEIEKELSSIREEIEAKEGRLNYMKNSIAMSTVHIQYYKTTEVRVGETVSYGSKIGNAIKSGFNALSSFFITLLSLWPFILIFVITLFVIRRRLNRKRNKSI
ncbi:MAG: hypothetical protein BM557_11155 [Flavobacterium sp. MedPE-SWcel]|uniref:DUF4349 domain-containing protein n=1 Tax=uncultured Flavobacterium sp. TaxID=165435 RepID=UPI000921242C|nr:DUF4349 domain-containing protein [uncultured Flavobacterium sp.]OIQ15601.1 MAG: hypothetical protein BM557_11155 [Flavobacterium sp. MedPE-SWcel]